MQINWLFIIVIFILLLNTVSGLRRGVVAVAFGLGGTVLALVLASMFAPNVSNYLTNNTALETTLQNKIEQTLEESVASEASSSVESAGFAVPEALSGQISGGDNSVLESLVNATGMFSIVGQNLAELIIYNMSFIIFYYLFVVHL